MIPQNTNNENSFSLITCIPNNATERRVKDYVMSRKNFLFHDTMDGAEASAIYLMMYTKVKGMKE